jgi:hypothetical protein
VPSRAVAWITPRFELSEHPEFSFLSRRDREHAAIGGMRSPIRHDTAIFLTWDDYGGVFRPAKDGACGLPHGP